MSSSGRRRSRAEAGGMSGRFSGGLTTEVSGLPIHCNVLLGTLYLELTILSLLREDRPYRILRVFQHAEVLQFRPQSRDHAELSFFRFRRRDSLSISTPGRRGASKCLDRGPSKPCSLVIG